MIAQLDRITVNPNVCQGLPTIREMRITVGFVLKLLASTLSVQEVLAAYPELEDEDIRQALNYAVWAVSDRVASIPGVAPSTFFQWFLRGSRASGDLGVKELCYFGKASS